MLFKKKPKIEPHWLIVGLGNPGNQYRGTRHNVGFDLIDLLALRHGNPLKHSRHYSIYESINLGLVGVMLVKPLTYMNLSGNSVKPWLNELKLKPDKLVVISDDVHLPVGKLRLREKGSAGGHNGHKSIIERLGTEQYVRLRVGIGNADGGDRIQHVLGIFSPSESVLIKESLELAAKVIESLVNEGYQAALQVMEKGQ